MTAKQNPEGRGGVRPYTETDIADRGTYMGKDPEAGESSGY